MMDVGADQSINLNGPVGICKLESGGTSTVYVVVVCHLELFGVASVDLKMVSFSDIELDNGVGAATTVRKHR